MDNVKSIVLGVAALLVLGGVLAGCAGALGKARGGNVSRSLKLFAFNYTDRYLMNITVDGMWMGGADAFKQGGGAMGPRPPRDRSRQHTIEVKWELSDRYDISTNKYVDLGDLEARHATVPIKFPYPSDPEVLILHFYPDGHVEAEMIGYKDNEFNYRRVPIPKGYRRYGKS